MKLSEVIREVVSLAKAANQARSQGPSAGDAEKRLQDFLQAQPSGVVYLLTAIMYFGRGDFESKDDFLGYYEDVSDMFGSPKTAARQMMAKEPLPDYLERGLQKLETVGLDVDKLAA
jgi:hypothetical protein